MPYNPQEVLGYWCNKAAQAFRSQLDKGANTIGLKWTEALVLLMIYGKPSSLVEIAKHLEHAHPSVLRQIDSLEQAGYVVRSVHPEDRRIKLVSLTDKGKLAANEVLLIAQEIHARAVKGFDEVRVEAAITLLRDVIINLDEAELLNSCSGDAD